MVVKDFIYIFTELFFSFFSVGGSRFGIVVHGSTADRCPVPQQ